MLLVALGLTTISPSPSAARFAPPTAGPLAIPGGLIPVRAAVNPSFDTPPPGTWTMVEAMNGTQSPRMDGWQSTHPATGSFGGRDHPIEVWRTGFLGVPSVTGQTHIELNANVNSAVYQDICLEGNEQVDWSFHHHARSTGTTEIVRISITDPNRWTGVTPPDNPEYSSLNLAVDRPQGWVQHSGTWNGIHAAGAWRFAFAAVQGGQGPSYGNLLDEVSIGLDPLVEFVDLPNVNPDSVTESEGAVIAFLLSGHVTAPLQLRLTAQGGTTMDGDDLEPSPILDGNGDPVASSAVTKLADGSIDIVLPPAIYSPNDATSYFQIPLDLTDAVEEIGESIEWQLQSLTPGVRPGDATCDGLSNTSHELTISAALDHELEFSTTDTPTPGSDMVFVGRARNVDALGDPGPIEIRVDYSPAISSLGASGVGWSCSNNSAFIRCFFTSPLNSGEVTTPITFLATVVGNPGDATEVTATLSTASIESNLTNNVITLNDTVQNGLPGTGLETGPGLSSGFGLLIAGFGLVALAWRLDLRGLVLQRGMSVVERGSTRWRG